MEKIIKEKLKEIEKNENVKIIGAFESGSRAWGFASPDSDYDVRFIYVRNKKDYLKLEGIRDVIEYPIDELLDINGWDVQKVLKLLYKSNPTVFEWCSSPIVYFESDSLSKFKLLLPDYFSCKKSLFHYLNMAKSNYRTYLKTPTVNIKKYFYVLRPLLAAEWIINKKSQPPMFFKELVDSQLDISIKPIVENLFQLKKEQPEIYITQKIQVLNDYIDGKLEYFKKIVANLFDDNTANWEMLNKFFFEIIETHFKNANSVKDD